MECACEGSFCFERVEELESEEVHARFYCQGCGWNIGVEGPPKDMDALVPSISWSDEAQYYLSRLPPYLTALVMNEVEEYARNRGYQVLTYSRLMAGRNKGMVEWSPDAERRLSNVPSGIRAMAKTELERTAIDRGMPEVTVALMEEVKTRYFGMGAGRS